MSILKLQKGTTTPTVLTITGLVRDVPSNNVKYGPQHKLVGHTPTDPDACIFLAPETAVRQLARVGLTLDNCIGHTVAITRPGDYIDFGWSTAAAPALAPPPAVVAPRAAVAAATKMGFSAGPHVPGIDGDAPTDAQATRVEQLKKLASLHKRCLQFVIDEEIPMLEKPKIGASPESVSALTAQLFIAARDAGLGR